MEIPVNADEIKLNARLQRPVFKKYPAAMDSAVLALEPYFEDTKNVDTLLVRNARKENLLWKQRYGVLICNLNAVILNECQRSFQPLLDKYLLELQKCPKDGVCTLIMGLPGAGKTTALNYLGDLDVVDKSFINNAFKPNADEIKAKLPYYDSGKGTSEIVHEESVKVLEKQVANAINQEANVIIELSGSYFEYIERYLNRLKKSNYKEINIVYIDIEANEAMKRIASRYDRTGRFLDPKVVYNVSRTRDKQTDNRDYTMHPADNYLYLLKLKNKGLINVNLFWVDNNEVKPRLIKEKSSYTALGVCDSQR